jgi:hypothetical protein
VTKDKFKHPFLRLSPELRERLRSSLSPEQQRRLMDATPSPEDLRRLLEGVLSQDELGWVLEGIPPPELSPEPPSSDPSAPPEPAPEPLLEPQSSEPDTPQRKVLGSLLRRRHVPDDVVVSRLHIWVRDSWVSECEALEIPPAERPGKPSETTLRRVLGKRKD